MSMILDGSDNPAGDGAADVVRDTGMADFEAQVLQESMQRPVLVDFWAPWCGPCRQLTPALEKAVRAQRGKIVLSKVNADENPELTQALRIQSLPTVIAFFQGRPLTAFQGAQPESAINQFIEQVLAQAGGGEVDEIDIALERAEEALKGGDPATAAAIYQSVVQASPDQAAAHGGLVRSLLAAGDVTQAKTVLGQVPPELRSKPEIAAAQSAVELADKASDTGPITELKAKVEADPDDHGARFDLAMAHYAAGQADEAVDHLLEIVARDRDWEEDKARKELLTLFEAMGMMDPVTQRGRRKLSSILFS